MSDYHISVLLQETIEFLHVEKDECYIDATLGGGGHAKEMLQRDGVVLGIDQDADALEFVQEHFKTEIEKKQLVLARGNFAEIRDIAQTHGFIHVSGILFDLGVSSKQFDEPTRGFSFQHDAPLDMRMDQSLTVTAKDLVNGMTQHELTQLLLTYGEDRNARRFADAIVRERKNKPIETTIELAEIVKQASHIRFGDKIHPATKVFQALRIAVNDELGSLEKGLPDALPLLKSGGRIAIIAFHSLEDRIVKQTFQTWERNGEGKQLTKKPVIAANAETQQNRRSRSAKLRVFQKA